MWLNYDIIYHHFLYIYNDEFLKNIFFRSLGKVTITGCYGDFALFFVIKNNNYWIRGPPTYQFAKKQIDRRIKKWTSVLNEEDIKIILIL